MKYSAFYLILTLTAFAQHPQKGFPGGCLQVPGEEGRMLPLLHTDIQAHIDGVLAQTILNQTFKNDTSNTLELTYIFPMPHRAAVGHYQFTIGHRVIEGRIQTKEKARQLYEQARAEGKTAALLEQQRPNIFTQNLTNIPAGASIRVEITYDEIIHTEDGAMQWVLPMVVGPRFMPENAKADSQTNPVYSVPTERASNTLSLEVHMADHGILGHIASNSHSIQVIRGEETTIRLENTKSIPNSDFILDFSYTNPLPELSFSSYFDSKNSKNNTFLLTLLPPSPRSLKSQILPREFFFILDVSGSMYGQPLDKAIATVKACMASLRPEDTFQIMTFAGSTSFFRSTPVHPSSTNIRAATQFLNSRQSGGGTYMMQAIKKSLGAPKDPERYRMAVMFTDGYIGNEHEIIEGIRRLKDSSRFFAFGIGSSVNRYLLEGMGRAGNGFSEIVPLNADLTQTAAQWENRLRSPVLTDLQVSINGVKTSDLLPLQLPDLFAGEPVLLTGHYQKKGEVQIKLTGKQGGRTFEMNRTVHLGQNTNPVLPKIWAREKIRDLNFALTGPNSAKERDMIVKSITKLGLNYRLMTQYTSFVAIDSLSSVPTQNRIHSDVSTPLPQGVLPNFTTRSNCPPPTVQSRGMFKNYSKKRKVVSFNAPSRPLEEALQIVSEKEENDSIMDKTRTAGSADEEGSKGSLPTKSATITCELHFQPGSSRADGVLLHLNNAKDAVGMKLVSLDRKTSIIIKKSMIKMISEGNYILQFSKITALGKGTWFLYLTPDQTYQFTI
jgi:Ca-activated chloride channel family protein